MITTLMGNCKYLLDFDKRSVFYYQTRMTNTVMKILVPTLDINRFDSDALR